MISYISSIFSGSQVSFDTELNTALGAKYVELFQKALQSSQQQTPSNLEWMKKELQRVKIASDHELVKKIDQKLNEIQAIADKKFPSQSRISHPAQMLSSTHEAPSAAKQMVMKSRGMSIEEATRLINEKGEALQELSLFEIDDTLAKLLAEKCPNITSLKIDQGQDGALEKFTDQGLEDLGKLLNLEKLTINAWLTLNVSREAYIKFLNLPHLKSNLTDLELCCYYLCNDAVAQLAQYQKLQNLKISHSFVNAKALEILSRSPTLKATLENLSFNLRNGLGAVFNDEILTNLSGFQKLQGVDLSGEWAVDNKSVTQLLSSLKNLRHLALSDYPMFDEAAGAIAKLSQLETLSLGKCEKLSETSLVSMLKGVQQVSTLKLLGSPALQKEAFLELAQLPKLNSLSISQCGYYEYFNAFCESPLPQKNLEHLQISEAKELSALSMRSIKRLPLKSLRIDRCPKFNDISFEAFINSNLVKTLETLELGGVYITDRQLAKLDRFANLKNLLLTNCNAITKQGILGMLRDVTLQSNLKKLGLDGMFITADMIKEFDSLQNLNNLIIGNTTMDELAQEDEDKFFKLKRVESKKTELYLGWGDLNIFSLFESK